MFRLLISFLIILFFGTSTFAEEFTPKKFISISPAMTEIMYAINAQDQLYAISNECTYPIKTKEKDKIGSGYILNDEKIIKIKPDYILALDSSSAQLSKFKRFGIEPLCFKYPNIEAIIENIIKLGELTGKNKEARKVTALIKKEISNANKSKNKRILYLLEASPMITIGSKSFIADAIKKSGNNCITCSLDMSYPVVSEEYAIKQNPDIVFILPYTDNTRLQKLFPNAKIIRLTKEQVEIISRPGPRIYEAVKIFAEI